MYQRVALVRQGRSEVAMWEDNREDAEDSATQSVLFRLSELESRFTHSSCLAEKFVGTYGAETSLADTYFILLKAKTAPRSCIRMQTYTNTQTVMLSLCSIE